MRERGEVALREHAERLGDCSAAGAMRFERSQLDRALADLAEDDRLVLERTADRIRSFAEALESIARERAAAADMGTSPPTVISMSHMLPRQELLPLKRHLVRCMHLA